MPYVSVYVFAHTDAVFIYIYILIYIIYIIIIYMCIRCQQANMRALKLYNTYSYYIIYMKRHVVWGLYTIVIVVYNLAYTEWT